VTVNENLETRGLTRQNASDQLVVRQEVGQLDANGLLPPGIAASIFSRGDGGSSVSRQSDFRYSTRSCFSASVNPSDFTSL
jgi:hypothetical protein